jgi:hypothetical protein
VMMLPCKSTISKFGVLNKWFLLGGFLSRLPFIRGTRLKIHKHLSSMMQFTSLFDRKFVYQLQWRSWLAHGTYRTVFMYELIINSVEVCRGREFEPRLEQYTFENTHLMRLFVKQIMYLYTYLAR